MKTALGLVMIVLFVVGAVVVLRKSMTIVRRLRKEIATPEDEAAGSSIDDVRRAASALAAKHAWLDAESIQREPEFQSAVDALAARRDADGALSAARSLDVFEAAIGWAALAARTDFPAGKTEWAVRSLRRSPPELEPFIFSTLLRHAEYPVIGAALSHLDESVSWPVIARFIAARRTAGEELTPETFRRNVARRLAPAIENFLERFEDELGPEFRPAFEEWRETTVDTEFLKGFGRVWERPFDSPPTLLVGRRRELVELVVDALEQSPRRSVLLVGEPGVGKTALTRAALERLPSSFVVFDATAAQVHAGAVYVGELETKIGELAENLRAHRAVWHFPAFHEAIYTGQHARSPQGLLDAMLPSIESGELTLVAETTPAGHATLVAERPGVASAFEVIRVRPLDETESLAVARHALEQSGLGVSADELTLAESFELAQQFLPAVAAPGNLLRIVSATAAETAEERRDAFDTADVLATIAAASGLPLAMLDPRQPLDLEEVRAFFEQRVLGQPEAVETLVERVAMAKAGLTDPTRPLGVFLFVGPTGTGKTEIAKALAEFMFGSPHRLVRLDMSEFQTPDSLDRLLADTTVQTQGANLIAAVRKDPFAVVLLDEFEKAAQPIWDLFLQVFDDGRLTDQQGRVADFRRCVIILTSNVGSSISVNRGVGFASEPDPFRPAKVTEALRRSFRPEFLNRIDRIVVFRPFERSDMRELLEKELHDVLERRGLRGRPWAVELDEAAYAFLIDRGFSPELGARPLKRAVEQHLLAPIARVIVEHKAPEGEQFLFVTAAGNRLAVHFVDPDAEPETEHGRDEDAPTPPHPPADVRSITLAPRADPAATQFLLEQLASVASAIRSEQVQGRKRAALKAINDPAFWDRPDRYATLAAVEYLDRLEAALETAERLGDRLARRADRNGDGTRDLVGFLANRLHVLDAALAGLAAGAPDQVFLKIRPIGDHAGREAAFAETLAEMYRSWAERRGMRLDRLDEHDGEALFAVTGLGCGAILSQEAGTHVLEVTSERSDGERETERVSAIVHVAHWPPGPAGDRESLVRLARTTLEGESPKTAVVRRYRLDPAPLVRDALRRYRTGRAERVLAGDFDLF